MIPSNFRVPGQRLKVVDEALGTLALSDPLHILDVTANQANGGHRLNLKMVEGRFPVLLCVSSTAGDVIFEHVRSRA